jgi:DNA excision repair protein ERCC-2
MPCELEWGGRLKYEVAVRTLCEFTAKRGDLDMRFTPSPTANEGLLGHRLIASRRGSTYEKELALSLEFGELLVRGRADGYDPEDNRLEEFKTYRGDLGRMPGNHRALHWAQLRIYGWLLCQRRALSSLNLSLVYFDIASERETLIAESRSAQWLEEHFNSSCQQFLRWAETETAHREARDEALKQLRFPYAQFHAGQRELAEAVYRRVRTSGALLAQAPTGIGKTVGTLFPALKALGSAKVDKVFYLVAKTSGRQMALDALQRFQPAEAALPLRVVELTARSKACENPGLPCDGAVCPLARGFYDRLAAARAEMLQSPFLDQGSIRQVALRHQVCPYYLSQELARWSDVVVGDYNYYFDRGAMLFGWTVAHEWRVGLLVDEAHNLVERGRAMYTAELNRREFEAVRAAASFALRDALDALGRAWDGLLGPDSHRILDSDEFPETLLKLLDRTIKAANDSLSSAPAAATTTSLQEYFFAALSFSRLAVEFDSSSLFEITRAADGDSTLRLRNLIPGRFLAQRFAAARTSVLFSATLTPGEFFRDILGLPRNAEYVDVQSPFSAEQLAVTVRPISTRFRDRERSVSPIAELVGRQYAAQPGNYLVFLSSFEYLGRVAELVASRYPAIPMWTQRSAMSESERTAFLERFVPDGQGLGFAVLGGAFAEGVDLPGSRLIGAFIATLGLPQVNPVNEEMSRRMEAKFGSGYEYTYLYPGIQKVVQAAGRVIRTPADRGVLYLIDDRFTQFKVRRLLPRWWGLGTDRPLHRYQAHG